MKIFRIRYQGGVRIAREADAKTFEILDCTSVVEAPDAKPALQRVAKSDVTVLAPVDPSKIVAVGRNYAEHARELGNEAPAEPLLFLKATSAMLDPEATIVRPRVSERVDFEGELAIIIGRRARNVSEADAPKYILGYSCANDVTARDLQKKDVQFTRAKSFDTFCPVGPCVETDLDPKSLRLTTRLNDEVKQDGTTADMIFPPAQLVSYISSIMTLLPGDLILTGTPAGVGPMKNGDVVEVEIESIGVLRNRVSD